MIGEFIEMESQLCYLHFEWILCYISWEKEKKEKVGEEVRGKERGRRRKRKRRSEGDVD